jgi:hypothetical protein
MARIARWHTSWRWAVAVGWLVCHLTAVSAQDGRWEHRTARGAQAFAQGDFWCFKSRSWGQTIRS